MQTRIIGYVRVKPVGELVSVRACSAHSCAFLLHCCQRRDTQYKSSHTFKHGPVKASGTRSNSALSCLIGLAHSKTLAVKKARPAPANS